MSDSGSGSTGTRPAPAAPRRRRALLVAMCACVLTVQGMVAAMNLAVPPLAASSLRPSPAETLWVVDSYVVAFACLLVPAGVLASRHGHRPVLVTGLAGYVLGCAASAVAPRVDLLIAARTLTGFGAALVLPTTLSILMGATEEAARSRAVGMWTASTFLAGAVGNVVAGVAVSALSWRALFVVLGAVALVLLAVVWRLVPVLPTSWCPLDSAGAILLAVAVVAFLYGVISGPEFGWASPHVLAGLMIALLSGGGFVWHGRRTSHPLLDLRVFRIGPLRAGSLGTIALFVGMAGLFLGNSQYLQYGRNVSPVLAGVASLPLAVGLFLAAGLSPTVAARFTARTVVGLGMGATAGGLLGVAWSTADTPYAVYALLLVVVACGAGLASSALSAGIMTTVPGESVGVAAGVNSLSRELGSALGVAVFGTVTTSAFTTSAFTSATDSAVVGPSGAQRLLLLHETLPDGGAAVAHAYVRAEGIGYLVLAGIVLLGAVVVLAWWNRGAQTR